MPAADSMPGGNHGARAVLELPVGLHAAGTRRDSDSLGSVDVPAGRYRGAQTQRSLEHFNVGDDRMPKQVYHAEGGSDGCCR
jgi:fumarate hydratase, class II